MIIAWFNCLKISTSINIHVQVL